MAQIQYEKGDIFESKAQVIVNTVNCQGVMGKGLALAFKQRYPDMFTTYQKECKTGKLRIGRPTLYRKSYPWILNFPTKDTWKANSKMEYLEQGLEYFVTHCKEVGITSIAFPKLGAQNGKLSWDDVGPLMVKYLSQLDIDVYIYIAEGDKEYSPLDNQMEKRAWQQFNEIALSMERFQNEVELSKLQAKKVFAQRQTVEFTSLSDIRSIDNIAQVAMKHIKSYIDSQLYSANQLPGMASGKEALGNRTKNQSPKPKRQVNSKKKTVDPMSLLFA